MKLIAILVLISCLAVPLSAQPPDEILNQSRDFAEQALTEIALGDRRAAVAAALKGLPDEPEAATLEYYPEAYEALLRAMAARVVNVDRETWQGYAVNSDGTRAVVMGINATMTSPGTGSPTIEFDTESQTMVSRGGPVYLPIEEEPPHILVDPRNGQVIADLMPFSATISNVYGPALPPAFSPDGSLVAAWHMVDGVVLRFRSSEGSPLPPLTELAGREPGVVIGFSPDGTLLAAAADGLVATWDATTGNLIDTFSAPDQTISLDWTHDGHLLALQVFGYDADAEVALSIYREGAWEQVGSLTGQGELPTQYMQVSKFGPHVLLDAETRVYLANWETGEVVDLGRTGASFHRFIRDGEAVGVLTQGLMSFLAGTLSLQVKSLDGAELTPTARDWVTFDQYVTINDEKPDNFGSLRPYTYRGDDIPDGPALWGDAMALLSETERAEVIADRIQPD
ncbi:WD40 repeat domain-containing protein [Flavimaricola marinus]|uniref:WD domain, G-beta repeat n=1 Tax=Flavimaricola marinus TaxID=1819565 RepID=A0A238LFA6_9RHOB|nr:WD40 repeat domain-containing protein [Flavimaricola marinus]SMY08105.1 hypothetical protein LOM8899_02254 [Flavimaricola marinus]